MSTEDISKYGFFIVICIHEDGTRSLCYNWDDCTSPAQFTSERDAEAFVKECQQSIWGEGCSYYHKYVSWSMYD